MKQKWVWIAVALTLAFAPVSQALVQEFFGADLGLGDHNGKLWSHPNADAAQAAFLANLTGVGTEDFEALAVGTGAPLPLDFGAAGTATLTGGSGQVWDETVDPDNEFFGRFAISGIQYFNQVVAPGFSIQFSAPVAAFGFYGTDIGDFDGNLTLGLSNGESLVVPTTPNSPGGTVVYYGYINTDSPFTSVEFDVSGGSGDAFGFDDLTIGNVQQVTPTPDGGASIALLGLAMAGLAAVRRRRS